jgi:GAF domain-containing protein
MRDEAYRHTVWSRLEPSLVSGHSVQEYLQSVVLLTGELIGLEGSYSLSTLVYGHLFTVATTDRAAWEADQVEYDTEAGPCVQALRHGEQTNVPDLELERRWPAWSAVSSVLGFRSAAGIPAMIGGEHRLALNLYSTELDAFRGEPMRRAELFTEEVARTMPTALRLAEHVRMTGDLQEALASRSTIDQALGVLMAQNRCSRDEAFGILRRASQHRNLKLREVAGTVIERFTGHPPAEPPPFRSSGRPTLPESPRQLDRGQAPLPD